MLYRGLAFTRPPIVDKNCSLGSWLVLVATSREAEELAGVLLRAPGTTASKKRFILLWISFKSD